MKQDIKNGSDIFFDSRKNNEKRDLTAATQVRGTNVSTSQLAFGTFESVTL
jgi:hypothetical protein